MKYCDQCGLQLKDEDNFCKRCGNNVAETENVIPYEAVKTEEPYDNSLANNESEISNIESLETSEIIDQDMPKKKKNKWIWVCIAFLAIGIAAAYYFDLFGLKQNQITSDTNLAAQDDWIYFVEGNLFKIRTDGSDCIRLSLDTTENIILSGEWIFYNCCGFNKALYKIRTDGSERTRLNDDESIPLSIENEWIYYVNASDNYSIYKIKTDGSNRTKIIDKELEIYQNSVGEKIMKYDEHSVDTDGKWTYYCNGEDRGIYKRKIDGTEAVKLSSDQVNSIRLVRNWIYFTVYDFVNDSYGLYRIHTDGSDRTKISDLSGFCSLSYADGWLYLSNGNLFSIKRNKSLKTLRTPETAIVQTEMEKLRHKAFNAAYSGIKLENGYYEKFEQNEYGLYDGYSLRIYDAVIADVNNDGLDDVIVFPIYNGGGSGSFQSIAVYLNGKNVTSNEVSLGDRIQVSDVTVTDGKIIVDYYDHDTDQAMADKPSKFISRTLILNDSVLRDENLTVQDIVGIWKGERDVIIIESNAYREYYDGSESMDGEITFKGTGSYEGELTFIPSAGEPFFPYVVNIELVGDQLKFFDDTYTKIDYNELDGVLEIQKKNRYKYIVDLSIITSEGTPVYRDFNSNTVLGNITKESNFTILEAQLDSKGQIWLRIEAYRNRIAENVWVILDDVNVQLFSDGP